MAANNFELRVPTKADRMAVHQLIAHCAPLDPNSAYCNVLQTHHFASTSVVAVDQPSLQGFVSGYVIPDRPDTLFIWQVAVGEKARGHGLAKRMLIELLQRPACQSVRYLETTITRHNTASWALFRSLAVELATDLSECVGFDQDEDFLGQHNTEYLVTIGPFGYLGSLVGQT